MLGELPPARTRARSSVKTDGLADGDDGTVCACAIDAHDATAKRAAMTRCMDEELLMNLESPLVDAGGS
jgi:hypothetical protein